MDDLLVCHTLGPQLIKLLGIPEHCTSFELRCAVGEIVTIKCEFYPVRDDGKLDALGAVLGEYKMVPRDAGHQLAASEIGFDAWMRARTDAAHTAYMAGHAAGGIAYT